MSTFKQFYLSPTLSLIAAVIIGGLLGYHDGGVLGAALSAGFTVFILSILETSVSFDNAVLNAKVLNTMSEKHRNWFMVWGILIAVVGMRLVIPVLLVSAVGSMSPLTAFTMALSNPEHYATILTTSNDYVSAFGGAFLLMVALNFFLGDEKESHWLPWLEIPLAKLAKLEVVITLLVVIAAAFEITQARQFTFVIAGVLGIALNIGISVLKDALESHAPTAASAVGTVVKSGIASLVYLEVLDASMSFDGVIGAFAITKDIFIVMLGLGVGSMFVRHMTLHLVEKKTIAEYRYLEHGALWAIFVLAALMFIKINHHVPEALIGLMSAGIIAVSVIHSHILNKKENTATPDATTLVDYTPESE